MENRIRLTESDLHRIIKESVKKVLNEADGYSYNGEDERNALRSRFSNEIEREENYKENIKRFKEAYRFVSSEYTVIKSLKRKPSVKYDAQLAFSEQSFLKYVKRTEGDTLFDKIWEKFGGEYGEVADQYIQDCIFKFQNKSNA